jgi:hypothetical protein
VPNLGDEANAQPILSVFQNAGYTPLDVSNPLRDHNAKLEQKAPDLIGFRSALLGREWQTPLGSGDCKPCRRWRLIAPPLDALLPREQAKSAFLAH